MDSGIFLINENQELIGLSESAYDCESVLQELLEKHPDLLAGNQIDEARPRRWLLVKREAGVPFEEGGGNRWSIDHLFLDQDGVPTIVEVKRSSDTRIRREVVGQMLDYAANGLAFWPLESLQQHYGQTSEAMGEDTRGVRLVEVQPPLRRPREAPRTVAPAQRGARGGDP